MSYDGPQPFPVHSGGTGDSSFTSYSVVCGGTTSTGNLQSVASVGTSGQILTSNGAAALPTFQTAPAGSKWVFLEKHSAASTPSIVFTSISSTYNNYIFVVYGIICGIYIIMQFSSDGGSTYDTSNYSGGVGFFNPGFTPTYDGQGTSEGVQLFPNNATTVPGFDGQIWLMNRGGVTIVQGNGFQSTSVFSSNYVMIGATNSVLNTGINTVRFTTPSQSSNITAGTIVMYGLLES